MRRDTERIEYSCQDLVDFTNPQLRYVKKINASNTEHFCYPCHVRDALNFVSEYGIAREEDRPFQFLCQKDVPPRDESNLAYIGEVVSVMTIKEVVKVLKEHPVAASVPIFETEYSTVGHVSAVNSVICFIYLFYFIFIIFYLC